MEKTKWPRQERVQRKERKRVLRGRGIKPAKKQWVICVETTAIEIPGWARAKAETRLTQSPHRVWFRGRNSGRAKILERQDRQAGGRPELTAVEYRVCQCAIACCSAWSRRNVANSMRAAYSEGRSRARAPVSAQVEPARTLQVTSFGGE